MLPPPARGGDCGEGGGGGSRLRRCCLTFRRCLGAEEDSGWREIVGGGGRTGWSSSSFPSLPPFQQRRWTRGGSFNNLTLRRRKERKSKQVSLLPSSFPHRYVPPPRLPLSPWCKQGKDLEKVLLRVGLLPQHMDSGERRKEGGVSYLSLFYLLPAWQRETGFFFFFFMVACLHWHTLEPSPLFHTCSHAHLPSWLRWQRGFPPPTSLHSQRKVS